MRCPRVAFLPDTFHEVNGVAHTSRELEAFARRRQIPFLSVHCGDRVETTADGVVRIVQLKRSVMKIGLDSRLYYDPLLLRYCAFVQTEVERFGAELIHVTGPGDMGTLGYCVARRLGLPLVISWHTSLHEYAAMRLKRLLAWLGSFLSKATARCAQRLALRVLACFYRQAVFVLAPNRELVEMLSGLIGKPVFLMRRGVDTSLFSPARRGHISQPFRIGYVGRLTAEKNVRFLAELARDLTILGREDFELIFVGEGREEPWLRRQLPEAIFTGVLRGERLAEIFASLDLFVFPSRTDTFGNVILEAFASGVPAVVTSSGGPRFLVKSGETGIIARSDWDFVSAVNLLMTNGELHRNMRRAARIYAQSQSWDAVFEEVFDAYGSCRFAHSSQQPATAGNA